MYIALSILTDIIILLANVKLVAEREGAVALELLREFDGCVRGVRTVTLPSLEAQLRVTGPVTAITDHVEHILLRDPPLTAVVVRTVDVQIVIDVHLQRVALFTKSDDTEKHKNIPFLLLLLLNMLSINTHFHLT